MQYKKGTIGRIFVVKFEHGEDLINEVKELAVKENLSFGTITLLGALSKADFVGGPEKLELPAVPKWMHFNDGREIIGFGTIVKKDGKPHVHIHGAFGKGDKVLMGCLRKDCEAFVTLEAVITEISGVKVSRRMDEKTGCNLLNFE